MDEPTLPERPLPPVDSTPSGVDIRGNDVRAGRDIVGGDVNVAGDSISAQQVHVQRGFSADQVQRLVLLVGGLVLITALIFFIVGAISAVAVASVLSRPLPGGSPPSAAFEMQQKIDALNSLEPGQRFRVLFTEEQISSYWRHIAGPSLGISNGKARLMDKAGQIALGGNLDSLNGLPVMAQIQVTTTEIPLEVEGVWVKILPTPEGVTFGWIPVTALAQNFKQQINQALFGKVRFTQIGQTGGGSTFQPEIGANLILLGVAE